MVVQRGQIDPTQLAEEVRQGLSAKQLGISEDAFIQLSENIARAIQRAVIAHAEALHRAEAHFGEEPREH